MKKLTLLLAGISCICFSACDLVSDLSITDIPDGSVFYWITSDADTYVECIDNGSGCVSADFNHAGYDFIAVAHTSNTIKRSYINFPQVTFPAGSIIEEAYFEMFHNATREDGNPDDILIDVNRVHTTWNASTLTYSNQPIPTGNGAEVNMKVRSLNWCTTPNMSSQMEDDLMGSNNFQGFLVSLQTFSPGYLKGFWSGNHGVRSASDLGFAPRLLLRVKLPAGGKMTDVVIGPGHGDGGGTFVGYRFQNGTAWPSDWNVASQH